jgi:hypothetical protein
MRERIEKILSKIKSFINRKRQELYQSIDSAYITIDLARRSVEMKVVYSIFHFTNRFFENYLSKREYFKQQGTRGS